MRTALIVVAIVLGVMVFFAFGLAFAVMGVNNTCVGMEKGIEAQYKQNQNNYDNFFKKVKETAQVPDMYVASFKDVYDGIMKGRYGENGSKAAFQWIQENNPVLDASVYKQIQQVIEAGRDNFEANQKTLLDKKRVYLAYLQQLPDGFIAKFLGFPKTNLDAIDIVTSDETDKVFSQKKSEPILLK